MERPIKLIKANIVDLRVDAIVNAANKTLLGGGGVDGDIHRAAGPKLLEECKKLNGCKTGQAKITKGYKLPAKYIIHTVGPIYSGKASDARNLALCYKNCIKLAVENNIHSIAFPSISTGIYGYPKKQACHIALSVVKKCLSDLDNYSLDVTFCCYSEESYEIYKEEIVRMATGGKH